MQTAQNGCNHVNCLIAASHSANEFPEGRYLLRKGDLKMFEVMAKFKAPPASRPV